MTTLTAIRNSVSKYNLVSNISKYKKNELLSIQKNIEKYIGEKNKYSYKKFIFGNNEINVDDYQYHTIISPIEDNIRIIACAGSGKTTTIVCRIKYLIDKGIVPDRILLTTFNVDAAENMKNKINSLFGFMPKIKIGTIDSIACSLYYKYFKKDEVVGVKEYSFLLCKYLKSKNAKLILGQYDYIFFDEFQDCNNTQYQILMSFYNFGSKITVIGDDSQNIYKFRGSDPKYIIELEKHIPELKTYKLLFNYRSTPEIITMANESILLNKTQIRKEMLPTQQSINIKPEIKHYINNKNQGKEITNRITDLILSGIKVDDIAILSRNNFPLKIMEEMIEKHNSMIKQIIHLILSGAEIDLSNILPKYNMSPKIMEEIIKGKQKAIIIIKKCIIKYISLMSDNMLDIKPKIKKDNVTLLTIHKSKGLEWKYVFLINCSDKYFPYEIDNLTIEEERRLFYVAITRAKLHLYISFTISKIDLFITRFVQEIPSVCYNFVNFNEKFFGNDNDKHDFNESAVTEIIKKFNEFDISKMKHEKIIPNINIIEECIHDESNIPNIIKDNYWLPDYGSFIDRYISRHLGCLYSESHGQFDHHANLIINSCILKDNEWSLYRQYIKKNMHRLTKFNKVVGTEKIIMVTNDYNFCDDLHLVECSKDLMTSINSICKKIIDKSNKCNINIMDIKVTTRKSLPKKFVDRMISSYKEYMNIKLKNDDILKSIYDVSLCSEIYKDRRRLLYRNDAEQSFIQCNNIFENIKKYVNFIGSNNVICKKILCNEHYDICGELDLIDLNRNTIIDYKCSESNRFNFDWLLQLLAYVALYKETGGSINCIEIYNPVKGIVYNINISSWNKHIEFLKYMHLVKSRKCN